VNLQDYYTIIPHFLQGEKYQLFYRSQVHHDPPDWQDARELLLHQGAPDIIDPGIAGFHVFFGRSLK
jgi:hypothetical protein